VIFDPEVTAIIKSQLKRYDWTKDEKEKFDEALKLIGKDWDKVSLYVVTRSRKQVKDHYHNLMRKLKKDSPSDPTELQTVLLRLQ